MKLSILAGALATLAAGVAIAGEPMSTASADLAATFKSLDTDGNGRISENEARGHDALNAGYRDAVSDSGQGMSMEEFNAWAASRKPDAMTPTSPPSQPSETPPGK